ncbi:ABC transporter substrate-binding protein [Methanospirillum lacunae]|uniref:ABC transporter substrate-binding protein n=1 Tax=Methanospirillum lacunae TaxID=668570 RepID=UPI0015E831DF|nr:ABC transporter substrate-binding protein [Methanospirillum lacunae]
MRNKIFHILIVILVVISGFGTTFALADNTKTVTDMTGRVVTVPSEISTVLCNWLPAMMVVYMVAPDKLGAWNSMPGAGYFPDKYANLPVIGRVSDETLQSMKPDVVIIGSAIGIGGEVKRSTIDDEQKKLDPIPVVAISETSNILNESMFVQPVQYVGKFLGEEKQAEDMVAFYKKVVSQVKEGAAKIPEDKKVKVYYAEGAKGVQTDPKGSNHAALIDIAGGINVADFAIPTGQGMTEVSMEQIISWNPDVILASDPQFYASVKSDPTWQGINAVKNGRVYFIPSTAYSWFDRPTGMNQIIGIPWTAKTLYPEYFKDMDLESLVKEYHKIFYHISLDDDQIKKILNP